MNSQTQTEKIHTLSSLSPLNNLAEVGSYGAALGGCEDIRAKSRRGRSPHWVSGTAEFRRKPDGAMHGGPEGGR